MHAPSTSASTGAARPSRAWALLLTLAILLIALGLFAMSALAFSATLVVLLLGWLLVARGVIQLGGAFLYRGFGGLGAEIFFGALNIALGGLLIWTPVTAGSLIALIIVGGLVFEAVVEGIGAAVERRFAWWLPVLIALLSLGLGLAMVLNRELLLPLLGLLVGATVLVRGVLLLLSALELRKLSQ